MDDLPGPSHDDTTEINVSFPSISTSAGVLNFYTNIVPDIQWTRHTIQILIDVVSKHFEEFYDKTIKKKVLWKRIANDMRELSIRCSPDDCDKKWRNLKKSYTSVLKKQTQGDFTSKFLYFDQMHSFLGKEIDPLGMREQALKVANREDTQSEGSIIVRGTYFEVSKDGIFEWTENAVTVLMNLIIQHKAEFESSQEIEPVWESITKSMKALGFPVSQEQCQRKWINLTDGFKHYQAEAETTGCSPNWQYFSSVRDVMNLLNVPVTLPSDSKKNAVTLKGSVSTLAPVRNFHRGYKRRRGDEENNKSDSEDEGSSNEQTSTLTNALKILEKNLQINKRLKHLEDRVQEAQKQKTAAKYSNDLLHSILGELRRINKGLEERSRRAGLEKIRSEEFDSNGFDEETPIVDEEDYQQYHNTFLNLTNFSRLPNILKYPKDLKEEPDEPDITFVVE